MMSSVVLSNERQRVFVALVLAFHDALGSCWFKDQSIYET